MTYALVSVTSQIWKTKPCFVWHVRRTVSGKDTFYEYVLHKINSMSINLRCHLSNKSKTYRCTSHLTLQLSTIITEKDKLYKSGQWSYKFVDGVDLTNLENYLEIDHKHTKRCNGLDNKYGCTTVRHLDEETCGKRRETSLNRKFIETAKDLARNEKGMKKLK